MKIVNLFILIVLFFGSCKSTQKTTSITKTDSVRVEARVDTVFLISQDTIRFDSLLVNHLLLEEIIDSLENVKPETEDVEGEKTKTLHKAYKQRYDNLVRLRTGANKDSVYSISKQIHIHSEDSSYDQTMDFTIHYSSGKINLNFDTDFKILKSETTNTTIINKRTGFFSWIFNKYTLFFGLIALGLILVAFIVGKLM